MNATVNGPVLLVCADQDRSFDILEKLYDEGFSTVGPAPTAGLALTLTAQTMARTAILAGQTTGRRSVSELAEELSRTWGVECFLLDDAAGCMPTEAGGLGPMTVLRRALGTAALRPAPAG